MGCGSSMPVSQEAVKADKQYFESVARLREKRSSISLEEARKRREECARRRSRRASVMAQLEAEKLTQRKRSNASMLNYSGSEVSGEIKIPLLNTNVCKSVEGEREEDMIRESSLAQSEKHDGVSSNFFKVSESGRDGNENLSLVNGAERIDMKTSSEEDHSAGNLECEKNRERCEEEIRQNEAKLIVQKAIDGALAKIGTECEAFV